jgi:thymidylate kinase
MFYLIEGLNCSGKTTHIRRMLEIYGNGFSVETPYANPLRWDGGKKSIIDNQSYFVGVYETMIETYPKMAKNLNIPIMWDRTFISAYVYGSIPEDTFDFLTDLLLVKGESKVIYMDTPVDICHKRLWSLRLKDPEYKSYVEFDTIDGFNEINDRFLSVLDHMKRTGIEIEFLKL